MLGERDRGRYAAQVAEEIGAHDGYFDRNMRRYRWARVVVILAAASVPVCSAFESLPRWVLGILGGIAAVAEALSQLYRWRDSALGAQNLSSALQQQLNLYNTQTGPYADESTAFDRFVVVVEQIRHHGVAAFNDLWGQDEPPSALPGASIGEP